MFVFIFNKMVGMDRLGVADEESKVSDNTTLASDLLGTLSSEVDSPLLLRDLQIYAKAIRNTLRKENPSISEEELDDLVKEDIQEMDEWLFSYNVDGEVWDVVLEKTN
jgi:hypothetical protein